MLRAIGVILSTDFFGVSLAWNKSGGKMEMEIFDALLVEVQSYHD
jgi:hypothetical protein